MSSMSDDPPGECPDAPLLKSGGSEGAASLRLYADVMHMVLGFATLGEMYCCANVCRRWRGDVETLVPQKRFPVAVDRMTLWNMVTTPELVRHINRIDLCMPLSATPFFVEQADFGLLAAGIPTLKSLRCVVSKLAGAAADVVFPCLEMLSIQLHVKVRTSLYHTQVERYADVGDWFKWIALATPHVRTLVLLFNQLLCASPPVDTVRLLAPLTELELLTVAGTAAALRTPQAYDWTSRSIHQLMHQSPRLTSVSMFSGYVSLTELVSWEKYGQRLKYLDLHHTDIDDTSVELLRRFTALQKLDANLKTADVSFLSCMPQLTSLQLTFKTEVDAQKLTDIIVSSCTQLTHLDLAGSNCQNLFIVVPFTDVHLSEIGRACPGIKTFWADCLFHVKSLAFLVHMPNLTNLELDNCRAFPASEWSYVDAIRPRLMRAHFTNCTPK